MPAKAPRKILSIDYGTKRVGVAISDDSRTLAFPRVILTNDGMLLERLGGIIEGENIGEIVMGESIDHKGKPNAVASKIEKFSGILEKSFSLKVHKEKEFLTTVEARRYAKKGSKVDASAAALILQRYLDKINTAAKAGQA
jgi:putative Holliday junction resolvase